MRTTALSAAVLITSIPLIVAEKLGSPDNQALAVAHESLVPEADAGLAPTAAPMLDLASADLHAVSVARFTAGIEALVADLLVSGRDSSAIATEIGRTLGKNFVSGLVDYSDVDPKTLIGNTAIIVSQLFEGALPSLPSWTDLVRLGFDEVAAPSTPVKLADAAATGAQSPLVYQFYAFGPAAMSFAAVAPPLPVNSTSQLLIYSEPDLSIY
ncbi:MAG: hypothetical protein WEB63_02705 [Cucumibacter sp.]